MSRTQESIGPMSALAEHVQGIDHLAIAVTDLEASIKWYTEVLGFSLVERRETTGAKTGMISAVLQAGRLNFVLLQGTSPDSQVSRFVAHYGPGIQHVAIAVDDIENVSESLKLNGLQFDTTLIDSGGLRQIFSKRDTMSGLMIELIERSASGFADQNVAALFSQLEANETF